MAKKFAFHGKTIDELSALPLEDFIKMVPSSVRRTMKRLSPKIKRFLERIRKARKSGKILRTQVREMPILPEMVGMRFKVHNGREYIDVVVIQEMLGRRLGEYSHTTKLVKHSGPGIGATRGSKSVELK